MPEPTPEMLALEAELEALGDWRGQLDRELEQMAEQTRRIRKLACRTADPRPEDDTRSCP